MSTPTSKTIAPLNLPPEVEAVFREYRTCELSTLAKDDTPITWPVATYFQPETGRFLMSTSIGLPQKAFNIRRNPKVSLLFSDSTGSGLEDPLTVLVQGDAEAPDEIVTNTPAGILGETVTPSTGLGELEWYKRQPAGSMMASNPMMRYLMDWYNMRLRIWITPRRILWWDHADFSRMPHVLVVDHVG